MSAAASEHTGLFGEQAVDDAAWWRASVEFYRREAEVSSDDVAAELLLEAGRLLAGPLASAHEAYAAFDAALARAPHAVEPLLARAELAWSQADWLEASECLRAALQLAEGEERVPLLARLATLAERHLRRPDDAYELLREAVRLAPLDRDLLIRLEIARPSATDEARREVLERRLAVTTALTERGALLAELGAILEEAEPARAARAYADAVAANPNIEAAVYGLVRTHLVQGKLRPLIRVLATHADRVRADGLRAWIHGLCGQVRDARLDDAAGALPYLERALEAAPTPALARAMALAAERAGQSDAAQRWLAEAAPVSGGLRSLHAWRSARALELAGGTPAEIADRLQPGVDADPMAVIPRLALRRQWWRGRDPVAYQAQVESLLSHVGSEEEAEALQIHLGDVALWWVGSRDQAR
ncbi:MAG: hypothetical protein R3F43_26040, partial [bacterium]